MLDAIPAAPDRLRGIAVVRPDVSDAELEELHAAGVRGIRCNTRNLGGLGFEAAVTLAPRIAPLGWMMQFQVRAEQLAELADISQTLGVPVVLDHFGFIDAESDREPLRRLLDTGTCYVKLSAPYRLGNGHDTAATSDLVRDLVGSYPERLLWGSDWPHTGLWNRMPDDANLIDDLVTLLGDDGLRQSIFVDTPHALFFSN
jgi:predicted TIM-barrel fold metal-dependent hydrolase